MMIIFSTVAIAATIFLVWWNYVVYSQRRKLQWMPGELGLPVLGKILEVKDNKKIIEVATKYLKKHNGLCWVNNLTLSSILATDYKFVEFILSSNQVLDKGLIYGFLNNWLGSGLLTARGSHWRKMRKLLTPTFHFSILEQFVSIFDSNAEILLSLLKQESTRGIVNVSPFVTMCTLDNICETAMGVKMNAQLDSRSEYVTAVKEMCAFTTERIKSVFGRSDVTYRLTPSYYKQKKVLKIIQTYTNNVISSRRAELTEDSIVIEMDDVGRNRKMAFLDLLLNATLDGQPLSNKFIRDEVNTFMFAGHDTTASTISSIIYCLASHPEVQKRAIEEQDLIFGKDINRAVTYRDLQEMKYLDNIIKEALRLYPPVPMIGRRTNKDIHFGDGKIIPAGIEILIFIQGINRNPNVFPEPDTFDPDRFENSSNVPAYSYVPFSAGPRNCIGQKFATVEIKATLSKLLRHFEFCSPGPGYEPVFTSEIVFHSTNGIHVQLKGRKRSPFL